MAQVAVPTSDVSTGSWTDDGFSTPLYPAIDTPGQDTDYIRCPGDVDSVCELGLGSLTDPLASGGHTVSYSYRKDATGGDQRNLTVALYMGTTFIAQQAHTDIPGDSWQSGSFTLSSAQADSITNYTTLRLRFTTTDLEAADTREVLVGWAKLEVPNAPASITGSAAVPLGGAATVTVALELAGNRKVPLGGSATATVDLVLAGSGAVPIGGSGTMELTGGEPNITGFAALPLGGSGTATVDLVAAGSAPLPFSAQAELAVTLLLDGVGAVPIGGSGEMTVGDTRTMNGLAAVPIGGVGSAAVQLEAAGLAAVPLGGSGALASIDPFPYIRRERHGGLRPVYRVEPKDA